MDRISGMEVLVAVAEEGNFTRAGVVLGLTPSAVSKAVARLEDRLGVRLLHRTTRRINLTGEGRFYLEGAKRILSEVEDTERAITATHAAPRGLLRVNASIAFAQKQLLPITAEFLDRYPDVRLQMSLSDSVVNLVEEGVDLAIRIGALQDSSLYVRQLAVNPRIVCAAPKYLERNGWPKKPSDLTHHNCLSLSFQTQINAWEFEGPGGRFTQPISGNFETNNADALFDAAVAGIGVARLAKFLVDEAIRLGELVPLFVEWQVPDATPISAVYPHNRHLSPKVRAFVDFLVEKFSPVPPWDRLD